MHPKEFRKTKNGTGHFTHLSLTNSEIYVGIDFTNDAKINELITNEKNACYVLYPSDTSINLNKENIGEKKKNTILFLIDSTWPCSRAILRASPNLDRLAKVSFTHTKNSSFTFKEQPNAYCLSTMESTLCVLELLKQHNHETLETKHLENFLAPFKKMVEYQLSCNL
jgi:DTW domain-containing protein YfiP